MILLIFWQLKDISEELISEEYTRKKNLKLLISGEDIFKIWMHITSLREIWDLADQYP